MHKRRIVILPMLLLIMLSVLGFAYAHWTDTIYIKGSVETGTLTVGFEKTPVDPNVVDNEGTTERPQDIGKASCYLEDEYTDPKTGKTIYRTLVLTVTNAYPSYYVGLTFVVKNAGTLPLHIKNVVFSDPTGRLVYDPATKEFTDTKTGKVALNAGIINLVSVKLHPCDNTKAEVDIHVKQDASQCTTYTILVTIVAEQAQ